MSSEYLRLLIFLCATLIPACASCSLSFHMIYSAYKLNKQGELPNSDLKKVGKTTRPFSCDLNQIPYDYTVEVRNRFKGIDLIESVS